MGALASILKGWTGRQRTSRVGVRGGGGSAARGDASTLAYPPVDPGIAVRPIDEVVGAHEDLIRRIKLCYGSDHGTFERELLALIRRYAEFVHLLPATADNYFSAAGGLFRMGLEVAFFSLQATDGHIFAGRSSIVTRRQLEPRWRHATFIAGLCCEIHRTLCHVIVTDERGQQWPAYLMSLTRWLAQTRASRFFLRWIQNAPESRSAGVFALPHVIPESTLQHLAEGNAVIVPHMMASISGMPVYGEHNVLDELVRHSVALVIDRDLRASAHRYGKPQLGAHLERYFVDALRRLAASNAAWIPNAEKSRVWFGSDGLFIVWPGAAGDICRLLEADKLPGIPKAPETILEILVAAGIVLAREAAQATWQIVPPESTVALEAVKLSSPAIVFAGVDAAPQPLPVRLVRSAGVAQRSEPSARAGSPAAPASRTGAELDPGADRQAQAKAGGEEPGPTAVAEVGEGGAGTVRSAAALREGAGPPVFSLYGAPMRLNPGVREALAAIVGTLNHGGAEVAACTVAAGLFVPLAEFAARGIEPAIALRGLSEAGMVVVSGSEKAPTCAREFGAEAKVGVVIPARFVAGLDPNDFA